MDKSTTSYPQHSPKESGNQRMSHPLQCIPNSRLTNRKEHTMNGTRLDGSSRSMVAEKRYDVKPYLVGNDWLFIPDIETREDFLDKLDPKSPTAIALKGGGLVELHGAIVRVPCWLEKNCKPQPVIMKTEDGEISGMAVRLRSCLAFLEMKYQRQNVKTHPFYMMVDFKKMVVQDLKQMVGDEVLSTRLPGLQAQATTDLRLKMNEIGVSPKMGKEILDFLGVDCDKRNRKDADGLVCGTLRYPWAGPKGGRNVVLRVLPDLPDTKMAMHPAALEKFHQGDTDGDNTYSPFTSRSHYKTVDPIPSYPKIEGFDGRNTMSVLMEKFKYTSRESAVQQVMGACIKDLTGLLIYTQYCLGQAYAVYLGNKCQANEEVLSVFVILVEAVMDAKKETDNHTILRRLATGLCNFTSGGYLDPTIFHPFLEEDLKHKISLICRKVGNMVEIRKTLGGALVAGGRFRERVTEDVVLQLLNEEVDSKLIIQTLIEDITLEDVRLRSMDGERDDDEPKEKPKVGLIDLGKKGLIAAFESITVNGNPVFTVPEDRKVFIQESYKDGSPRKVRVRIRPVWLKDSTFTWNITFEIPQVASVSEYGHALLTFEGRTSRMLHPFYYLDGEDVKCGDVFRFLQDSLVKAVEGLTEGRLKSPNSAKLAEEKLNQVFTYHVNSLPNSDPVADVVYKSEYKIKIPDDVDILTGWTMREKILNHISGLLGSEQEEELEFNIQATKKSKPGTIVTRVGEHGVPDYTLQVNPFATWMPSKRLVEMREMAMSLAFAYPEPLPLTTKGFPIAEGLTKNFTTLRVAVFDCSLNHSTKEGEEFSHDTMLGCPSMKRKTTLAGLTFTCQSMDKVEMMKERLARFDITDVEVVENPADLGGKLVGKTYELKVNRPIEDVGKLKSLGAIKAVPVMIPFQLFAQKDGVRTEIDFVVSRQTFVKKECLDAALYLLHAEEGKVKEIDPKELIDHNQLPDGMHTIIAVYQDGTEDVLGEAMVGLLPFYRPMQTGVGLCDLRPKSRGIRIPHFGLPLVGWDHHVSKKAQAEMADLCQVLDETVQEMGKHEPKKSKVQKEEDITELFPDYAS